MENELRKRLEDLHLNVLESSDEDYTFTEEQVSDLCEFFDLFLYD